LLDSVLSRFTTNQEKGEKVVVGGKQRRIVTADVLADETYVMAALLDPRIKPTPFKSKLNFQQFNNLDCFNAETTRLLVS